MGRGDRWTENEIDFVRENYADMDIDEMVDRLDRTWKAIQFRAYLLGLHRNTRQKYKSLRVPLSKRFWDKVDKSGPGDCWEWKGATTAFGYGVLRVGSKIDGSRAMEGAHRISYELKHGKIPEDMLVCHKCDNPPCVNPRHLFVGTYEDNIRDCRDKDRLNTPSNVGEDNPRAILTEEDVRNIRETYDKSEVPLRELADRYGVAPSTISDIVCLRNWTHI